MNHSQIRKLILEMDNMDQTDPIRRRSALIMLSNRERLKPAVLLALDIRLPRAPRIKSAVEPIKVHSSPKVEKIPQPATRKIKVSVCMGKACRAKGAEAIVEHFRKTSDSNNRQNGGGDQVQIRTCSCLGRCGKAPVVVINGKTMEKYKI